MFEYSSTDYKMADKHRVVVVVGEGEGATKSHQSGLCTEVCHKLIVDKRSVSSCVLRLCDTNYYRIYTKYKAVNIQKLHVLYVFL
jgi:hypothetical protein